MGGIVALFHYDIKKIIAYSTCSQLGYMFISCGVSNYHIALFHLFNHGFFKALLFLSAGSLIHIFYDEQDMRKFGKVYQYLPLTYICFIVGSLSIMGLPGFSGFFSKDLIIISTYSYLLIDSFFLYNLTIFGAFLTGLYSFRLLFYSFYFNNNYHRIFLENFFNIFFKEDLYFIFFVIFVIFFPSLFIGFFFSDFMMFFDTTFWGNSIFIRFSNIYYYNLVIFSFNISFFFKLLP